MRGRPSILIHDTPLGSRTTDGLSCMRAAEGRDRHVVLSSQEDGNDDNHRDDDKNDEEGKAEVGRSVRWHAHARQRGHDPARDSGADGHLPGQEAFHCPLNLTWECRSTPRTASASPAALPVRLGRDPFQDRSGIPVRCAKRTPTTRVPCTYHPRRKVDEGAHRCGCRRRGLEWRSVRS